MTNPEDPFDEPGTLQAIKFEEHAGQLLLITPHELQRNFPRLDGPGDVVTADVVVVDYPGGAIEYKGTVIFPKMIIGQVRQNIGRGRANLGRVGKGQGRPGQSAPWVLQAPTEGDKQAARAYLANPTARPADQVRAAAYGGATANAPQSDRPPF